MSELFPPPERMSDRAKVIWREIVAEHVNAQDADIAKKVGPRMEVFCGITANYRDASARVEKEGLLIQGPRGEGIPHPGIAIMNDASRELSRYGDTYQARPRRRNR